MRNGKLVGTLIVAFLVIMVVVAVSGQFVPPRHYEPILPNETAFSVPVYGNSSNQAQIFSSRNLSENKVTVKNYLVPYTKIYPNAMLQAVGIGQWVEANKVIKIDLSPVTAAWTKPATTGTSSGDQALGAETRESVGFSSEWTCQAQVDEANAADFVHSYYGQQLKDIMDNQIRRYVQQQFTAEAAKYTLNDTYDSNGKLVASGFLSNKATISKAVFDATKTYFASRGIDILNLGMQDQIAYNNPQIQASIDKMIQSNNDYQAQKFQNQKRVETAQAASKEAALLNDATAIKLRELDIARIQAETARAAVEKWKGDVPNTMVPGQAIPFIGVK